MFIQGFTNSRGAIISGLGQDFYGDPYDSGASGNYNSSAAIDQMVSSDAAAGVDTNSEWYRELLTFGSQAMQAWTQLRSQDQIMQLNVERARAGLPPIDPTAYGPAVGVGLDARTRELLQYALIGGGALLLFALMKKR